LSPKWYGIVYVDLYSAIVTKVSNALTYYVSGGTSNLYYILYCAIDILYFTSFIQRAD